MRANHDPWMRPRIVGMVRGLGTHSLPGTMKPRPDQRIVDQTTVRGWGTRGSKAKIQLSNSNDGPPGRAIGSSSAMITSEPLMGSSNYLAWASSIELWCKGQGVQDHLINNACVVDEKAKASEADDKANAQWEKVDAQLCSLLWHRIY
ncbi:hypothetical protein MTR67_035753 [Solanum verrucosum]|uniref:Uncharacterized protein n=1 Tax=Solanum verrucosum TaxID=315347 RepID=A0AAF0UAF6_SOLVR|nr:hypothetical protein MTR67_035753 [Solanum verrucosum]